jgi:competence protein ComEC
MLLDQRCAYFSLGLLFALWGAEPVFSLPSALALLLCMAPRERSVSLFICCLGFALGCYAWSFQLPLTLPASLNASVERSTVDPRQSVVLRHELGLLRWHGGGKRWCAGTRLQFKAQLRPPIPQAQHGQNAAYRRAFAKGELGRLSHVSELKIVALPSAWNAFGCHLRQGFNDHLERLFEPRLRSLARALFLGERESGLQPIRGHMNALGLAHLIAVSGLHVGTVLGFLLLLLRLPCLLSPRYTLSGRLLGGVILGACTFVCWWCAWPVGGVRLMVWAAVALIAPHRPLTVTGWVSLLFMLLYRPAFAADLGFLLSHGISLVLVHGLRHWRSPLAVPSLAALGSMLPLALVGLPSALLSAPVNLVLVPAFICAFGLSMTALVFGLDSWLSLPLGWFVDLTETLAVESGAKQLHFSVGIRACAGLLVASLLALKRRGGCALAALAIASWQAPNEPGMQVWMLPIGHGDAALVSHGNNQVVIDMGPTERQFQSTVLPLLRGHPDLAIISHADRDHIGGLGALCRGSRPKQIWEQTGQLPASCPSATPPRPLRFGELKVEALAQADDWLKGRNERSLVTAIKGEGVRLLFLGDIGLDREMDLDGRFGRADLVKIPHHGSRSSSSLALIRETQPRFAFVGAAPGDRFGHPHTEILRRWQEHRVRVEIADQAPRCRVFQRGRPDQRCLALNFLRRAPSR